MASMRRRIWGGSTRALEKVSKIQKYQSKIAIDSLENVNENFAIFQYFLNLTRIICNNLAKYGEKLRVCIYVAELRPKKLVNLPKP